jgi:CheY-like chemotaxis protein
MHGLPGRRRQGSSRTHVEQEVAMSKFHTAIPQPNGAEERHLMAANAAFTTRQTDEPAGERRWTRPMRDKPPRDRTASEVVAPAEMETGRPASAARVLVAEDNPINQMVLAAILRHGGMEPVVVNNGAEAVDAWERQDWDVILMDVQMPVLDGVSATRAIRLQEASSGRAHTPIIAVTANVLSAQVRDYQVNGMDGVVAKPIEIEQLFMVLERTLSTSVHRQHG